VVRNLNTDYISAMQLWVRKELTMAVRTVMTNCTMVFHFLRFLNINIRF